MSDLGERTLDHVALRVADRTAATEELVEEFDLHVIEQTERFTLLGARDDYGKLTLLDTPDGETPTLGRIVSVVLAEPDGATSPPRTLRCGLVVTFTASTAPRHALVGLGLRAVDPPIAAAELERRHGMHVETVTPDLAVLAVGGAAAGDGHITVSRERWDEGSVPMLDHVGVRVQDAARWREHARSVDVDEVRWVEAPHSRAVFVQGPEGLLIEYVQQTAAFAAR